MIPFSFFTSIARLGRDRRALFYSLAAIILLGFLAYAISFSTQYTYRNEMFVAKNRVQAMNTFLLDIGKDMERAIYITSFRSLLAMQQDQLVSGQFFNDTASVFVESFMNGTVNGENLILMNDSTFTNWTRRMQVEAEKMRINVSFEVQSISLSQPTPWEVQTTLTASINLTDDIGTARWNTTKTVSGTVSILEFEDPLYVVNSNGKITNTFRISPFAGNFTNGTHVTNLKTHLNQSYYMNSALAPNYLMRLQGNLSNSSTGIESMVNLLVLEAVGLDTDSSRSAIDYVYFGTDDLSAITFKINNTYESWFRLDNTSNRFQIYQVTTLSHS